MESSADSLTSTTLLGRLRQVPTDQAAWAEFVDRYAPRIFRWCCSWGLQGEDAEEVSQIVLVKLAHKISTYDWTRGSFRGWLWTVARHAWSDFVSERPPDAGSGDSQILEQLHSTEARDDLVQRLDEEFSREVMEEAKARVRLRVKPHTWDAFQLLAIEGLSGAEVARRLNMKVATVYVARGKVQKMLREEIEKLEDANPA